MQQANTATVEDVDDVDDVGAQPAPTPPLTAPTMEAGADPQTAAGAGADAENPRDPQTATEADEVTDENGVHFLDAVGRKYLFPYEGVRTWKQFDGVIRDTFNHIGRIRTPVLQGQYDIYDAQERIVLPSFWERTVRPGSRFEMRMWPETNPRRFQPGMPPPPPPPSAFQPGAKPPPPPGTLYDLASGRVQSEDAKDEPVIVEEIVSPLPKPSLKKQNSHPFLAWLTGKGPKKSLKKKVKTQPFDIPQDGSGSLVQVVAKPQAVQPPKPRSSWPLQPLAKRSLPRPRPPPSDHSGPSSSSSGSSGRRDSRSGISNSSSTSSSSTDENSPSSMREFVLDEGAVFSLAMSRDDLAEMESKVLRRPTFLGLERALEPSDCLRFSSARIMGSDGSEPLELVRATPWKAENQQHASSDMTWIHVQRTHMNFNEFENIACFELAQDTALRNAVARLFQKLRDKLRDKDWYIKPGTVLRCDIHLKDDNRDLTDLSPVFASIPNLHVAKFNRKLAPEPNQAYCPPRRLHEAFGQLDQTAAHDKTQQFRKQEGAKTDEILWEGQTWILVTKSGLITYGDVSRSQLESDNITVSDPVPSKDTANQIVQLIDNQNRLSFAPLEQCRSFFELQGVVRHHAERMDYDVYDASVVRLQTASGEELTAGKWAALLKGNEIPMIRWQLEYEYLSDYESSDDEKSSFISSPMTGTDGGIGPRSPSTTRSAASSLRSRLNPHLPSSETSSHVTLDHDENDLNFLSQDRENAKAEEEEKSEILEVPESDSRVPPFLSWLPADAELSESGDALMKRLALAESGIMRIPEKSHLDGLIEDSYKAFQETDVFYESQPKSFKDFEYRRKSLKERQNVSQQVSPNHGGRFSHDDGGRIASLADNLLDLCTRVFEAFAPKELPAPSISRCFGALSRVLEDPVTTAILDYADDADIPDPDPDDTPSEAKTNRWVIALRAQTELPRPGNTSCDDCEKGRVYDKTSAAVAHLRRSHAVGLGGDASLGEYVLTLKEGSEERLRESYLEILRRCCKTMAGVARKTANIQAGVLYQDGFRRPIAGLPPPLFKAFKLLVVFLCALPRLLDTVSWRFKDDVIQSKVRHLSSTRLDIQRRAVYRLGAAVEDQVYNAERALVSPELFSGRADALIKGRLMEVVQPSYVAAQVIWNLTRIHVYEDKHVADLYDGYLKIQRSHVLRRPEKRLVLSIGALKDEMTLVSEFISTQFKAIEVFAAVLSPDSRASPVAGEVDAFEQLEMVVFERTGSRLLQLSKHFQRMDKACDHLAEEVRGLAEIMADQNSRAMMIFTIVTVFFLPPGFVAAYLSMGDGPDGLDFEGIQRRFWTIAGPLTVTVWTVCLFLAFGGSMNSPLDKARAAMDEWRVRRAERHAARDQREDEEESPYVVEYGV